MGVSALFIMLCHNTLVLPDPFGAVNVNYIKPLFQCAVDVFLLLSGLGCYYSLSKNSVLTFYKHRFLRLLPPYLLFLVLYAPLGIALLKESAASFFWHYSLISFFIEGDLRVWFVAAIIFLYIIFPLLFFVLNKNEKVYFTIIVLLIVIVLLPFWGNAPTNIRRFANILLVRLPIFMIGTFLGKKLLHPAKPIPKTRFWLHLTLLIVFVVLYILHIKFKLYGSVTAERLLHIPISIFVVSIICCLFEKIDITDKKFGKALVKFGGSTLEVYLIHERLLAIADRLFWKLPINDYYVSIMSNAVSIVLASVLALALHFLVIFLTRKLLKKTN